GAMSAAGSLCHRPRFSYRMPINGTRIGISGAARQGGLMSNHLSALVAPIFVAALAVDQLAVAADVSFTLKYGVLAGLTGDPAPSGQGWNEAARLAVDQAAATLKSLNLSGISVELADSQDSQGNAQAGVEAAQKLVQIDRVNVIIGDFYSSVTSAAATAVAI